MIRKVRLLRATIIITSCSNTYNAVADNVAEHATHVLIDKRVWGCSLFVYFISDGSQHST